MSPLGTADFIALSAGPETLTGCGSKITRLSRARAAGFNVPDGIAISHGWLTRHGPSGPSIEAISDLLQALDAIGVGEDDLLAVRSSAADEDGEHSSSAGLYLTTLRVARTDLPVALKACLLAASSTSVSAYRARMAGSGPSRISILVQRFVEADAAGVVFSKDPLRPDGGPIVEACAGTAENLVAGITAPSRWRHERGRGMVASEAQGAGQFVADQEIERVADLAREAERTFGFPVDVEWAIGGGHLYLLQIRPITARPRKAEHFQPQAIKGLFSRALVQDLWSDRTSAFAATLMFEELQNIYTIKRQLRLLGLHDVAAVPAIHFFDGYAYVSSTAIAMIAQLLPKSLRVPEIAESFPEALRPGLKQMPWDWKRSLRALLRSPLLLTDPAAVPFLTAAVLRRRLATMKAELEAVPVSAYSQASSAFYQAELERLVQHLAAHQQRNESGYGLSIAAVWFYVNVARSCGGLQLLDGMSAMRDAPANATFSQQWEMAALRSELAPVTRESALNSQRFREFLERYRFRAFQRDPIAPRWDEQPESVLDLVLRAQPRPRDHQTSATSAPVVARLILRPIGAIARHFLALREDLRSGLDAVFYRIRRLLMAMAQHEPFLPISKVQNGIFHMSLGEVRATLAQGHLASDLAQTVARRAEVHRRHADCPFYITVDESGARPLYGASAGAVWTGVGVSPGVAVGPARVIRGPEDFGRVRTGDVLIARNTDPGWTALFASASGIVVEIGGILNHCAIVAREFGVPAVVGLSNACTTISDGQRVRVDGSLGFVEILPDLNGPDSAPIE